MRTCGQLLAAIPFVLLAMPMIPAARAATPVLNKTQVEQYLRYAEGFTADVHFKIDDPTESVFPGFYRLMVHLTTDAGGKLDRIYFVTPDGQRFINGSIWDMRLSPFAEALSRMPDSGYAFGPDDAKVKMVIFSDFQCPYCREFAKVVRDNVAQKYPKDVRVLFEDFPIDSLHPWARAASEAAHCVGDQNLAAFWTYHDWMFQHQSEVKKDNLRDKVLGFAKEQNLDVEKIGACMDQHADAPAVERTLAAGRQLQVQQTPTVFINGRAVPGALPWPSLDAVIQIELRRPVALAEGKVECCQVSIPGVIKK